MTELSSSIFIYSLENPTYPTHPLPDVQRSILPPSVPSTHAKYMDAAELACHPTIPNVLYASNRYEMHLDEKAEGLLGKVKDLLNISDPPKGDGIAIVLLDESGSRIEQIKHVRTECDAVRAMRVSPDGKYVALGGQEGGGVELWSISGERGDEWKLAAKNPECAHITDIVWV